VAVRTGVDSGIPGVSLLEGDHICAFYRGDRERDRLLSGYLSAGITAGDRCVCLVDSVRPTHVTSLLADCGCDLAGPGQLSVQSSGDTYLGLARFDAEVMLDFWEKTARASKSEGFQFTRAVGEMTWALRPYPGVGQLIEYESKLNRFLPSYPQIILCLYDLERFGGEVVMNLIRTHPRLLVNGALLQNPYYEQPGEFLARLGNVPLVSRPRGDRGKRHATSLQARLSDIQGLLIIGMLMTGARHEKEVARLTMSTVPALVPCDLVALALKTAAGWEVEGSLEGHPIPAEMATRLLQEAGQGGGAGDGVGAAAAGFAWTSVHPLQAFDATVGRLVVASRSPHPQPDESRLLLQVLATQAATNLANARLHEMERTRSEELRSLSGRLEEALTRSRRILEIHELLNAAAANEGGVPDMAAALHRLVGFPLVIEDEQGGLLAVAGADRDPRSISRSAHGRLRRQLNWANSAITSGELAVQPVRSRGELLGSIWLVVPRRSSPDDIVLVALEYAATVMALALSHERRLAETELRLRRDFTEELLEGLVGQNAGHLARAKALGLDLDQPARVAVVRSLRPASLGGLLGTLRGSKVRLATLKDGQLAFVASLDADLEELRRVLDRSADDTRIAVGVGSVCHRPEDYPRSYLEAMQAVQAVSQAEGGLMRFDDLGVLKVLLSRDDPQFLQQFIDEWLRPLIDYDEAHHAELVRTLATYFDSGGNQALCSTALFIHVSTLKYRLQRIRDISGHDLSDPNVRFHLQLATKASWSLEVLRTAQSGERPRAPRDIGV
jgi:DNA-binding PucR family transcriptional regulator